MREGDGLHRFAFTYSFAMSHIISFICTRITKSTLCHGIRARHSLTILNFEFRSHSIYQVDIMYYTRTNRNKIILCMYMEIDCLINLISNGFWGWIGYNR